MDDEQHEALVGSQIHLWIPAASGDGGRSLVGLSDDTLVRSPQQVPLVSRSREFDEKSLSGENAVTAFGLSMGE